MAGARRLIALAFAGGIALAGCTQRATKSSTPPAPSSAQDASFDCGRASTALEKVVCGDPKARAADGRMSEAYRRALAVLPAPLQPAMRESQRAVMKVADQACRRASGLDATCIIQTYDERTKSLGGAPTRWSDGRGRALVARQVDQMTPDGALGKTIELVQIARPSNPAEAGWNAAAALRLASFLKKYGGSDDDGPNEYRLIMTASAPGFIEAVVSWKGPPRWGIEERFHWSLAQGRELQAGDLFNDPSRAFDALAALAVVHAELSGGVEDKTGARATTLAEARKAVADLSTWSLDETGLTINIDSDPPVFTSSTIPWSEIRPLLRGDPVFDPTALKAAPYHSLDRAD